MNINQAIDFVNANLAVIGSAARMQNPAALKVQAAYAALAQRIPCGNRLVLAVQEWQKYCAANPGAEV